ncbi:MAG: hypothetical protein HY905_19650 [Deltaproteobacteria bacterium]|nr:hypothetical protein [Deltaproteobacteria bacterium]
MARVADAAAGCYAWTRSTEVARVIGAGGRGGGGAWSRAAAAGARTFRLRARFVPDYLAGPPEGPEIVLTVIGLNSKRYATAAYDERSLPPPYTDEPPPWETWAVDVECLQDDTLLVLLRAELEVRHSCDVFSSLPLLLDDFGFDR